LTSNERVEVAQKLRDTGLSYDKIGAQLGVSGTTIQRWLKPEYKIKQYAKAKARQQTLVGKKSHQQANRRWRQKRSEEQKEIDTVRTQQWKQSERGRRRKREYDRERYSLNRDKPEFRLPFNLRSRLYQAVRNQQKSGSAVRDLGCSIEELKQHLESQFQEGMTWENYGQWHIDHIKPLASFDLSNREQFLQACHYTNLQPLWAEDNLRKGCNAETVAA